MLHVTSSQVVLVITNFSDFDLELLFLVADVLDGDVDDRQPRRLRVLQAEDGPCPFLVLMLKLNGEGRLGGTVNSSIHQWQVSMLFRAY